MTNKRKGRKKRGFWDRPHDWDKVLIDLPGKKITRGEIRDYYWQNRHRIFPYLKGKTVMVLMAPKTNYFIYKRHKPAGGFIKITKLEGIDDPSSYEYWINRIVVEFHTVIGAKTDLVWVDIDPHERDHDPQVMRKMEGAITKVVRVLERVFPNAKIEIWASGKRGIHVEGRLPGKVSADRARKDLRIHLDKAFSDDKVFTTGIARPGQIRLDVTTLKRTGSIRTPYSFTVTGRIKEPYQVVEPEGLVARFKATLRTLTGKAANPTAELTHERREQNGGRELNKLKRRLMR